MQTRAATAAAMTTIPTPLGEMVAAAAEQGVCLLEFNDRSSLPRERVELESLIGGPLVPGEHEHLALLRRELEEYFRGELRAFTVPIWTPGTPFQQRVWRRLLGIPYGRTESYERIAIDIGSPGAQRAVGRTNGQNRIAIVVPCHRVVEKSGALRGYGGGLHRKQFLLDLERGQSGAGTLWEGPAPVDRSV